MIDIQTQGFDNTPHGIIDLINRLDWPRDSLVHIIDPLNQRSIEFELISQHTAKHCFVIINTHEGASHHWFNRLIPDIDIKCGIPLHQIVLRSSCLYNPNSPIAHMGSVVDYVTDTVSEYPDIQRITDREITHHYVCLNAQHRWQRWELIKMLIDHGITDQGCISYLELPSTERSLAYRRHFPMILDRDQITWKQGHDIDFPALQGAAINVITESSYEQHPDINHLVTHHLPGLTEKTFKSILLGQIPIFVAPMMTVQCYRDIGFDAFDDIVDHDYDREPDPMKRLTMIFREIGKFCSYSLAELSGLLIENRYRFQHNLDRLRWFSGNHDADLPKWQQWLRDWKFQHIV